MTKNEESFESTNILHKKILRKISLQKNKETKFSLDDEKAPVLIFENPQSQSVHKDLINKPSSSKTSSSIYPTLNSLIEQKKNEEKICRAGTAYYTPKFPHNPRCHIRHTSNIKIINFHFKIENFFKYQII